MQNYPRKLALSDWNMMMKHSLKLMLSMSGLAMCAIFVIIGGGAIYLIMGKISMIGLGYFILQPAVITIYLACLLARYRSGNNALPVGKELRNIILALLIGTVATALLISLLWLLHLYMPVAGAAETHPVISASTDNVITPQSLKPQSVAFVSVFPVMFNIYSIATLSMMGVLPCIGIIIGVLVNCNAPLHKNLGILCRGLFRNIGTMIIFSLFTFCLLSFWSVMALKGDMYVFLSLIPLTFLSVMAYVIAEQIYMPEKRLTPKNATTGK
ncbi:MULTISPECIES: hypothetical protein [Providencia]|uniref:Uncharacterized protein n=1 Tax=Providencia rettgeri TaxID=587 RepID=A0AAW6UQW4_PRORE|nr:MULTISPECIES: hypothetical protein [Providencia]MDI9095013.1 hypothetical protein [Providencia rettgeri]